MDVVRSVRQQRARLSAEMRAEGKTWGEIAAEFAERYQVGGLTAMRLAHGMTQPQVVAEWCRRWPKEPRDDKALSCWERWPHSGHAPSLRTLDRLAEIYECSVVDLLTRYGDHRDLDTNAHPNNGSEAVAVAIRNDYLLSDLAQMTAWSEPGIEVAAEATVADVVAIQAMSAAFQTADLLASIGGPAEPQVFAAAASLTEAAGWMAHDTGNDQRARAHLSRAFRLARAAGSPALIGNVCASMSHLARQLDQPDHAVRLAEVGLQHAHGIEGVAQLVARLHATRARALSRQGAIGACLAALDAAEQALEAGAPAAVEWVSPFDAGSLASDSAVCLRAIGDLTAAERHARRAIELRPGDRVRSRALAQLTLAEVLIDVDRIDEAATTGQQVCEAAQSLNSTQVLRRLDGLGDMLETHASLPVVGSFLAALTLVRERRGGTREADESWPT